MCKILVGDKMLISNKLISLVVSPFISKLKAGFKEHAPAILQRAPKVFPRE